MKSRAAEYYYSEYYTGHYKSYYAASEDATPSSRRPRQKVRAATNIDLGEQSGEAQA